MKICNFKMFFPLDNGSAIWKRTIYLSIFILGLFYFISPVNAAIIDNPEFIGNFTGWASTGGGTGSVNWAVTWSELNATTQDGMVTFYTDSAFTGPIYARLTQTIDVTDVDEISFVGRASSYFSDGGATGGGDSFIMSIGGLSYRVGNNVTWETYTLDTSSITGEQELKFELYTYNKVPGIMTAYYNLDEVIIDEGNPSINFNPDIEITEENQLYYDYDVGIDYTEENTFVYSFYEPNTFNVSTFEGYTEYNNDTAIPMSPIFIKGNYSINLYYGPYGPASLLDAVLLASDTIFFNTSFTGVLEYTESEYLEYGDSVVNYNITNYKLQYPLDTFYLTMLTPQSKYSPYYYYELYELTEDYGQRSLEIGEKSAVAYPYYQNCTAWITKYNETNPYVSMGDIVYANVTGYNHTLLKYSNYDFPENESYITGQYITVLCDIDEYIETDYLGYPYESFTLWIKTYSNSNEGNKVEFFTLNSGLWIRDSPYTFQYDYRPYQNSNFNATVEVYIDVYRLGDTTRLTPTIYTNMYSDGYNPENDTIYEPPEEEEPPENPDIPDEDELPENPDIPEFPDNQSEWGNDSINMTWTTLYYTRTNNSLDAIFYPIYNFTNYTVYPILRLNNTISTYNVNLNETFTESSEQIGILSGSIDIILSGFPPKIVNLISYYLMWLILLIILRKR